jgi:hypothetical protein
LNPADNPAQPKQENPITPWLSKNDKGRLKTIVTLGKPMPMEKREPKK